MSERCPTCGSAVEVRGDGTTHWYAPVRTVPRLDRIERKLGLSDDPLAVVNREDVEWLIGVCRALVDQQP